MSLLGLRSRRVTSIAYCVLVLVAVVACCSCKSAAYSQNVRAHEAALAVEDGLNADDATDIHATDKFEAAIRTMVYAEDFDRLDKLADSLRSSNAKFSGGMWKIHLFYEGTKHDGHATEEDWKTSEQIVKRWVAAKPNSITARVALAYFYVRYAWNARGDGYANSVTQSGWRLHASRTQQAKDVLEAANNLPTKCPEWFLMMQHVAQNQSWSKQQALELFKRATAYKPDYYYYYRLYASFLLPKWNGEPGETETFIQESADRIGGTKGDILYFRVASTMACCGGDVAVFRNMSYPRIKRGFAESEKSDGPSLTNLNSIAYMAVKVGEADFADSVFKRIGDQWSESTWRSRENFEENKQWAAQMAPMFAYINGARENTKSPEGRRLASEFMTNFASTIQTCLQDADPAQGDIRLVFELGADGTIGNMQVLGGNPHAPCLFQLRDHKLSPPPSAPFRLALQIRLPFTSAKGE